MGGENHRDIHWNAKPCCGDEEKLFLVLYFVYAIIILLTWQVVIWKPFKLMGVFLHEAFGHAGAAWLTCGKVKKIEVYESEAGVAHYSGGVQAIIIPAGYVGGAFWAATFVTLSANRIGATIAASIITAMLVISLAHNPNKVVVYLSLGFTVLTVLAIIIDWFVVDPFLQYVMLFYGVFFGIYAVRDVWDDCVARDSDGSDAQACHKLFPCCLPRFVGVQFLIMAVAFQIIGIWLALVWLVST